MWMDVPNYKDYQEEVAAGLLEFLALGKSVVATIIPDGDKVRILINEVLPEPLAPVGKVYEVSSGLPQEDA